MAVEPVAAASSVGLDRVAVSDVVVGVIAEQTGYPVEMLEPDLDLEADLSIDSIKRTEVLGELAGRLGLAAPGSGELDESVVEELAAIKTVRGIVDWIVARPGPGEPAAVADPVRVPVQGPDDPAWTGPSAPGGPGPSAPGGASPVGTGSFAGMPTGGSNSNGTAATFAGPAFADVVMPEQASLTSAGHHSDDPSSQPALAGVSRAAAAGAARSTGGAREAEPSAVFPLRRYVVEVQEAEPPAQVGATDLRGARFLLVEGGLGVGLATRLERAGAEVRILAAHDRGLVDQIRAGVGADGLAWIASADPDAQEDAVLPAAFPALRAAALGGCRRVLVVTGDGGRFGCPTPAVPGRAAGARVANGAEREIEVERSAVRPTRGAGLAGLVRTIAREVPGLTLRLVDVEPKEEPRGIADSLFTELLTADGPLVVGYRDGARAVVRLRPAPGPDGGALPAALDASAVVLLTGGARGITARVAVELARRSGCAIELVGRTPLPTGPEDAATASASDAPALRRAFIAAGVRRPAEIEARIVRLLAEREVRATLATLGQFGSSVRYHAVDVRDPEAVAAVVADVYARHGRLDGIIHGAGVLADRLLRDKTSDSFERVYDTKVGGARALLAAARDDIGFVALFGSVAGVFGNRGQVDYAAGNDALDTLARAASGRFAGRVVSVDWGPWGSSHAGGGMVSPELAREYARRGIGLIDPVEGVEALLAELAGPLDGPAQVVYMCADAEAFDA